MYLSPELPQKPWHHGHNKRKWLKQPQSHFHWAIPHKICWFFWHFDVCSVRLAQIFQVQAKISKVAPMFPDYLSVSYDYGPFNLTCQDRQTSQYLPLGSFKSKCNIKNKMRRYNFPSLLRYLILPYEKSGLPSLFSGLPSFIKWKFLVI